MARGPLGGTPGRSLLAWVPLALNFYLLDIRPFWVATLLVVASAVTIAWMWGRPDAHEDASPIAAGSHGAITTVVAALGLALLLSAARSWLAQILIYPHDPQRADMLVVIQLGIRRLLQGHTPYTMYQVPWPVTLPYGPVLWGPMVIPFLLHADVRFATLLGALFVPAVCAMAAITRGRRDERASAAAWLVVLAAIVFNADLRSFISIGHTEAYWPLVPLFAWALYRERWLTAAVACGLLVVGRTTMIALVPALLAAVWYRDRARTWMVSAALAAAVALPLLPFAVVNLASLRYAFYGSYQTVIKGFVWTSTDWVQHTVGLTGLLLARGWQNAVEPLQAAVMIAVAVVTCIRIKRGENAVVWSGIGLLAFSMTTLWPVVYLYFDVFLLFVSAALAQEPFANGRCARLWWWPALAVAAATLAVVVVISVPARAAIDVGRADARQYLYAGFSADERAADRNYAWVDGTTAKILVPSRARRDARIEIVCEPYIATRDGRQQVTATLNGVLLGNADVADGWHRVVFNAPARAWVVGANELDLFMASAASPRQAGEGSDSRQLSIAIDRVDVTAAR